MQIATTRFGLVTIEPQDILHFAQGLVAFEDCQHWVLLSDAENESLGWLQSVNHADIAVPVISPRKFVPQYQVRVQKRQLSQLELRQTDSTFVLCIVSKSDGDLTVNLRAPIVINLDRRLGRQLVTSDEQPVALMLSRPTPRLLRAA